MTTLSSSLRPPHHQKSTVWLKSPPYSQHFTPSYFYSSFQQQSAAWRDKDFGTTKIFRKMWQQYWKLLQNMRSINVSNSGSITARCTAAWGDYYEAEPVAPKSFQEINSHSSHALPPCSLALNYYQSSLLRKSFLKFPILLIKMIQGSCSRWNNMLRGYWKR